MNFKEKLSKIKLNKKLFLKIYISILIILVAALIILQILGSKSRIGYLSEFDLLETNYNENTTNYIYHFKIGYYNKTFKHSDIYEVYPNLSNLPEFVKEIKMDKAGSPFGNLISDRIIEEEKIDNINYTLKIKIILYVILILSIILYFILIYINLIFIYINKIYILSRNIIRQFLTDSKYRICGVFLLLIICTVILNKYLFLDAQLWAEDGKVFLQQYIDKGIISIFNSYAGYYHLIPRIITIVSFNLSILFTGYITFTPFFMNIFSIIIGNLCICYLCSDSFYYIGSPILRILLCFAIFLIPFSPEVFFNVTNLHWLLSYFIFLVSLNVIHYNKFPNYFISIITLFFLLSTVCGIFITFASCIILLRKYINSNKNISNIVKSFKTKELIICFILNIGAFIQLFHIILFSKRINLN